MNVGVQFTGTLGPQQKARWFTFGWPAGWHVAWHMMPTTPAIGAPEIGWDVEVERADPNNITYWLTVQNFTNSTVNFEGRYAVLN